MAIANFGDVGGRSTLSRNVLRRQVARLIALRDLQGHRRVSPHLIGMDDAGIAMSSCDRRALERAGRGAFIV